jgi:hypothetical protein
LQIQEVVAAEVTKGEHAAQLASYHDDIPRAYFDAVKDCMHNSGRLRGHPSTVDCIHRNLQHGNELTTSYLATLKQFKSLSRRPASGAADGSPRSGSKEGVLPAGNDEDSDSAGILHTNMK